MEERRAKDDRDVSLFFDDQSDVLSNLHANAFMLDFSICKSMESFLQSLKHQDHFEQINVCNMNAQEARERATDRWQTKQTLWWNGKPYDRQGENYHKLLERAYLAMMMWNSNFCKAIASIRGEQLFYNGEEEDVSKTILTKAEFCKLMKAMHNEYWRVRAKETILTYRPREFMQQIAHMMADGLKEMLKDVPQKEHLDKRYFQWYEASACPLFPAYSFILALDKNLYTHKDGKAYFYLTTWVLPVHSFITAQTYIRMGQTITETKHLLGQEYIIKELGEKMLELYYKIERVEEEEP
ncbi:MAG: hypothetical protein LUC44_03580 [Prevotellaceae bacterium]|nr:hypothetical protein [Prevotellaceae bacterium]